MIDFRSTFAAIVMVFLTLCLSAVGPARADTLTYTYDTLNRLTKVEYANGSSISYAYDAAGNRLTTIYDVPPTPANYSLGVNVVGSGTVTSSPAGIDCGVNCLTSYTSGTAVTLTAAPFTGYVFNGWGGACSGSAASCMVTMTTAQSVTATFGAVGTVDTEAPTVPAGLAATPLSASQVNLTWMASMDNVAVTGYKVYRNSVLIGSPVTTSYSDTGLSASTTYSYTVAACDAAGNCSVPSAAVSATTLAAGNTAFSPQILAKWNLLGNTGTVALDVTALFGTQDVPVAGVNQYVLSVWKWVVNPSTGAGKWAFFTPSLTKAESDAAALAQGYDALITIDPGEGFWVNRTTAPGLTVPVSLSGPASAPFYYDSVNFGALKKPAWHLIATDSPVEPSVFNSSDVVATPPSPGKVPTGNFQTLWAWSAGLQKWYFYSTSIEANGYTSATGTVYTGLDAVRQAAVDAGYLDFHTATTAPKTLGSGVGFWVRR